MKHDYLGTTIKFAEMQHPFQVFSSGLGLGLGLGFCASSSSLQHVCKIGGHYQRAYSISRKTSHPLRICCKNNLIIINFAKELKGLNIGFPVKLLLLPTN